MTPAGRRPPRGSRARGDALRARVTVYPRRVILDPQGKAVRGALVRLGFAEVEDVRAGKSFEIELAAESEERASQRLREMCEKLLANTVVEEFEIELLPGRDGERRAPAARSKRRERAR